MVDEYFGPNWPYLAESKNQLRKIRYPVRKQSIALWLVVFFGGLGMHRFYTGRIITGFFWLITGGLFGVGTFVDGFQLLSGRFKGSKRMSFENDASGIQLLLCIACVLIKWFFICCTLFLSIN